MVWKQPLTLLLSTKTVEELHNELWNYRPSPKKASVAQRYTYLGDPIQRLAKIQAS